MVTKRLPSSAIPSNTGAKALYTAPSFADEATAGANAAGAGCTIVYDESLPTLLAEVAIFALPTIRQKR